MTNSTNQVTGWQCPVCSAVMSPTMLVCVNNHHDLPVYRYKVQSFPNPNYVMDNSMLIATTRDEFLDCEVFSMPHCRYPECVNRKGV